MTKQIPWLRVLAEGVVIVLSILLAFGIEAWWDRSRERAEERQLLVTLHEELTSSRIRVVEAVEFYRAGEEAGSRLAQFALSDDSAVPSDFLILLWATLFEFNSTHFETDVLDGTLDSGRLDLISDANLRKLLGAWPRVVGEFTEQEVFIREFFLANQAVLLELPEPGAMWVDPPAPSATDARERWKAQPPSPEAIQFVRSNVGRSLVAQGARLQYVARRDAEFVLTAIDELLDRLAQESRLTSTSR